MVRFQKHGTLIVIGNTDVIKSETNRLCDFNRGIKIHKFDLFKNLDIVNNIASIDGAIMMDTNCCCYGIGVILDGEAIIQGNSERGARYNSAINYIENRKKHGQDLVAVIISEDKTLDIYGFK